MQKFEIEICASNIQSAIAASKAGANRIELCANIYEAGTTPSAATIKKAKELTSLDVFVLIRPRGGNFVYDEVEKQIILEDIKIAKEYGADGVVVGALNNDASIDYDFCSMMKDQAKDLQITFHRAFDHSNDYIKAIDIINKLEYHRVLTSGMQNSALDGIEVLKKLNEYSSYTKIMAGAGINENNIFEIHKKTGITMFHATASELISQTNSFNNNVIFNGYNIPENTLKASSANKINKLIYSINK